jgi:hypothetical protein
MITYAGGVKCFTVPSIWVSGMFTGVYEGSSKVVAAKQ